jgi:hypothetical protein|nr:MAG TPA: hydrogenase/urease nickel incorporation protein [Caudoviricetes sp.]
MDEYISRKAAIAYIREQSEECQKAFEELGGESGIYADAYNDLAEDFYSIPAADVAPVVHGQWDDSGRYTFPGGGTAVRCTECGCALTVSEYHLNNWNYCPVCGAKMDGGDSDASL